jgi:hypothetical protein
VKPHICRLSSISIWALQKVQQQRLKHFWLQGQGKLLVCTWPVNLQHYTQRDS